MIHSITVRSLTRQVRKAVEQLSAEGLVYAAQGSGTSVSTAHPNTVPFRFADSAPSIPPTYRVITKEVIPAAMAIAERLSLPLGEPVIHIRRLRLEGEAVAGFSERFLPQSLCPDLLAEDLAGNGSTTSWSTARNSHCYVRWSRSKGKL